MRRKLLSVCVGLVVLMCAGTAVFAHGRGGAGGAGGHPGMRGPIGRAPQGMGGPATRGRTSVQAGARPSGRGPAHPGTRPSTRSRGVTTRSQPVASGRPGHPHHHHHPYGPGGAYPDGTLMPVEPGYLDGGVAGGAEPEEADDGGVLLTAVTKGAAADAAGLRAGDVILSFGAARTQTFEELQDAVQQAGGPVKVVFINGENGQTEYLTIEPEGGRIGVSCE